MIEHVFAAFVRTKTLFKQRLKDLKRHDTLRVYACELDKLGVNNDPLLWQLKESGNVANKFRSFRVFFVESKAPMFRSWTRSVHDFLLSYKKRDRIMHAKDGEKFVVWLKTKPIDKTSLKTLTLEQLQLHEDRTKLKGGSFCFNFKHTR